MKNVPRGTIARFVDHPDDLIEKLNIYEQEIRRWNPKINLISPNSMDEIWQRHFIDSLQLLPIVPRGTKSAVDLGSGGGFPALVLAAATPDIQWTLVESDQRKCVFLRSTARAMGLEISVISERIEHANIPTPDLITARALADLNQLLNWAEPFAQENTIFIFPKGKSWENELTQAGKNWQMRTEIIPSKTHLDARIVRLSHVKKAN